MLRYQVFLSYGIAFLAFWWWAITRKSDEMASTTLTHGVVLPLLGGVGLLGVYLLARLVIGVASFQDCHEAAVEISAQIKEAKAELRKRKIIID
jgi:Dolichol-phosphate mannosyltransferase subunit 3 (DPM3)